MGPDLFERYWRSSLLSAYMKYGGALLKRLIDVSVDCEIDEKHSPRHVTLGSRQIDIQSPRGDALCVLAFGRVCCSLVGYGHSYGAPNELPTPTLLHLSR